jgi:hypothetical protein
MAEEFKDMVQRMLDSSYNVYSSISAINSSISRAATLLGLPIEQRPISLIQPEIKTLRKPEHTEELIAQVYPQKSAAGIGTVFSKFLRKPMKQERKEEISVTKHEEKPKEKEKLPPIKYGEKREGEEKQEGIVEVKRPEKAGLELAKPTAPVKPKEQAIIRPTLVTAPQKPRQVQLVPPPLGSAKLSISVAEKEKEVVRPAIPQQKLGVAEKQPAMLPVSPLKPVLVKEEQPAATISPQISLVHTANPEPALTTHALQVRHVYEEVETSGEVNPSLPTSELNVAQENPIDKMLSLVREHKSITLSEAAGILNVSRDQAEVWAKILNGEGLINLSYKFMGDALLEA